VRYQFGPKFEAARIGEEAYILLPLQVNPEASTMILAPNFVNQLVMVESLAKNIPMTHKLYVKEHPAMLGRRPREFYEEIQRFPNVRLIDAREDNFRLIRHADLVVTATGTGGWEAILMGRPVITFGNAFYADLGFSERCSDINQLGKQIHRLVSSPSETDPETRQERLLLFITSILEGSFPISKKTLWPEKAIHPGQLGEEELHTAHSIADQLVESIESYYSAN
jgi:hypothetical protein